MEILIDPLCYSEALLVERLIAPLVQLDMVVERLIAPLC